eukprot:2902191-Prymnesium_polylepis.1
MEHTQHSRVNAACQCLSLCSDPHFACASASRRRQPCTTLRDWRRHTPHSWCSMCLMTRSCSNDQRVCAASNASCVSNAFREGCTGSSALTQASMFATYGQMPATNGGGEVEGRQRARTRRTSGEAEGTERRRKKCGAETKGRHQRMRDAASGK